MWDVKVSCYPPSYTDAVYDYVLLGEKIPDRSNVTMGWGSGTKEWVERKRKWVYIRVKDPKKFKRIMQFFADQPDIVFSMQVQRLEFY